MNNQESKSKSADSEQRSGKGLSVQRIVVLSGKACFALMIATIWIACGIVACATGDTSVIGEAGTITLLAGVGYMLLH